MPPFLHAGDDGAKGSFREMSRTVSTTPYKLLRLLQIQVGGGVVGLCRPSYRRIRDFDPAAVDNHGGAERPPNDDGHCPPGMASQA